MRETLRARAEAAGIETGWTDNDGRRHEVPDATLAALLDALGPVAAAPPPGRHARFLRCPLPRELGIARSFGIACGLWSLRREPDPGIGDFADLEALVCRAAEQGSDFVALLPLHARFPADPAARSPYAPSSRRFLDVFAIACEQVPEVRRSPAALRALEALHARPKGAFVEHEAVGRGKLAVLEAAFEVFRQEETGSGAGARGAAFLAWRRQQGRALEDHCRFDALQEHMLARDRRLWSFHDWPPGLRRADSPAVEAFAREHAARVDFFAWLQWLAHGQLERVQARARAAGMRIGLLRDLAVGLHPAGSAAWSEPEALVRGVSLGAPPDAFNPLGQDWGLAPFAPQLLLARDLEPLVSDFRSGLESAGALRIDHVMGLERQFWIPAGASPAEGAYVRFPFAALASRLAEEARARNCLVVGEDLGTVPAGFRVRMRRRGMLGIRVLWFERTATGGFRPPARFPELALACLDTHDLPTLRGFLEGRDIAWRERLGILDAQAAAAERRNRERAVQALLASLRRQGLLGAGSAEPEAVAVAAHGLLARTRSALAVAQIEDLAGEAEQPNLPGTVDEHPNWKRRLPTTVDALFESPLARGILATLRQERGG